MVGKIEEAESLQRGTLEAQERTLGPDHPSTLTTLNSLAALYREQGRLDDAEETYCDLIDRAKRSLPEGLGTT